MSKEYSHQANEVFDRLKSALGITTDTDLAQRLGINASTVATSRSRNRFNHGRVVQLCAEEDISLDWIYELDAELKEEIDALREENALLKSRLGGMREALDRLGVELREGGDER